MLAVKAKIYGVLYKQFSSIAFDETSMVSSKKLLISRLFIGHYMVHVVWFPLVRVVHLPKRTETSLITESDQSGPNHQLLQLCTARTAWSEAAIAGFLFVVFYSCECKHEFEFHSGEKDYIRNN